MSEKLTTQSVMATGSIVHIRLNLPEDEGGLFRVVFADTVGICVTYMYADNMADYDIHPQYVETSIRGAFFYPWASVDYLHLVMDANNYTLTYGGAK